MKRLILLKKFGILDINKLVEGHKATSDLYHVFFNGDWHAVPIVDVEEIA